MPAQTPPGYRRRVVRAGLGIGATLTFFVLAAAARAEVLSAPPVTLSLAGQTLPTLLFAALLGFGAVLQAAGVYRPSRAAALIGAALVVCAGLFDRDPVLVVGQIVLVAALWPASKKKTGQARRRRHSAG